MIIDITGIELTPGNYGMNCLGNGTYTDKNGNRIECCCDECDYLMCCVADLNPKKCKKCNDKKCPRNSK